MKAKKNDKIKNIGFWDGEKCEYCNGEIFKKLTELTKRSGKKYFLLKKVPTGVCQECGTKYYSANVLKSI